MNQICNTLSGLVLVTVAVYPASAQSLGDVARREEARRKIVSTSGRIYTNDTLRPEPATAPPPTPASPPAVAAATVPASPSHAQGQAAAAPQPDRKKDEGEWRGRITEARQGLARAQMFQEALHSRINGLSTDFLSRDDPAQRRVIGMDRQKAAAELDRVTKEIAQFKKAIADIEEDARRAGVPPGWLR